MVVSGVLFSLGSGFQEMGYAACQEIVPDKYRMWAVGMSQQFTSERFCSADDRLGVLDSFGIIAQAGPLVTYSFIAKTSIGWRGAYWYMCAFHGFFGIVLIFTYYPPSFSTKHKQDGRSSFSRHIVLFHCYANRSILKARRKCKLLRKLTTSALSYSWQAACSSFWGSTTEAANTHRPVGK